MMNVVARELRDHPAGCELAKFRVRECALALRGRKPLEHREIQPAEGGVGVEGGGAVGVIVEDQPSVLIERLRNVAVLAGGESRPRGQRELRLRQMNDDAPRAPLAGRVCPLPLPGGPFVENRPDLARRQGEGLQRIFRYQLSGVRVVLHLLIQCTLSRRNYSPVSSVLPFTASPPSEAPCAVFLCSASLPGRWSARPSCRGSPRPHPPI